MGDYWSGIKTDFSKIDSLKNRIKEFNFDYIELIEHSSSQQIDFKLKTTQMIQYSDPIEYGIMNLNLKEKKMYSTFFFHTFWRPMDGDDNEFCIDKAKYTGDFLSDDLGWLKIDSQAYWKSFNVKTLELIIKDYEKINFNIIKENYQLEVSKIKKEFSSLSDFNSKKYQLETEEIFTDFVKTTKSIIEIYKNCVKEKKDLIIDIV